MDQRKTRPDTDKGPHQAGELKRASQLGDARTDWEWYRGVESSIDNKGVGAGYGTALAQTIKGCMLKGLDTSVWDSKSFPPAVSQ